MKEKPSKDSFEKLQSVRLAKAMRIPGGNNTQSYFEVGQIGDARCDAITMHPSGIVEISKGKFTRFTTVMNCYELTPYTGESTTAAQMPTLSGPPGLPAQVVAGDPNR